MTRDVADMFKYDLWANRAWMDTLLKFPEPKRPDEVLTHILGAQWRWLERCNDHFKLGLDLPAQPEAPSTTLAEQLNELWLSVLDRIKPEDRLEYTRDTGEHVSIAFGDIAQHVANHGTYHRGHLRGLAEAQMVTDFPETDFSRWAVLAKSAAH
jgi:uncharacterized damage-inducible protein DinB